MKFLGGGHFPVQLVVHYWEIPPQRMTSYVHLLRQEGIQTVVSFVPWQLFETDISHSLQKFIMACSENDIQLTLVPTPELAIHLPYSGIPRDLMSQSEAEALDGFGDPIRVGLPPRSLHLPSFLTESVERKYFSYLSRFNVFISDLARHPRNGKIPCRLFLTSSFWKYYRSNRDVQLFKGKLGDRSKGSALLFRKAMEARFSEVEFARAEKNQVPVWKYRENDEVNRRWFFSSEESKFRQKTENVLLKNGMPLELDQVDLFIPEADPSQTISRMIQLSTGGKLHLKGISQLVHGYAQRTPSYQGKTLPSWTYWSGLGSFRDLADSEKQYLILATALNLGGTGGGVWLDVEDWLSLSTSFRNRIDQLATEFLARGYRRSPQGGWLTSNVWSDCSDPHFQAMEKAIRRPLQILPESVNPETLMGIPWLGVDSQMILTAALMEKLFGRWFEGKKRLFLPDSSLWTTGAKEVFRRFVGGMEKRGAGHYRNRDSEVWLLPPGGSLDFESMGVGGVSHELTSFTLSDPRLEFLDLRRENSSERAVFVMNAGGRNLQADMIFDRPVWLKSQTTDLAPRLSLEVPTCGVLPILVDEVDEMEVGRVPSDRPLEVM